MTQNIGRNEACPCGSGKKHKNCCEGKARFSIANLPNRSAWIIGVLGVAAIAFMLTMGQNRGERSAPAAPPPVGGPSGGATAPGGLNDVRPEPWAYDAASNQHFDPAHNHWHQGPPPPQSARGAAPMDSGDVGGAGAQATPPGIDRAPEGTTPQPYEYDAATNQYWDPAHGHWHRGRPPVGAR